MNPSLTISPEAAEHLSSEIEGRVLRVAFTTGCGGSGYRLSFESEPQEEDVVIRDGNLMIALDDMSAKTLDGAVIRYDAEEDGYTLDHPDAVAAVWCG